MSLDAFRTPANHSSFPRVSGDEPLADAGLLRALEFSPRERG